MGRVVLVLFLINLALVFAAVVDCLGGERKPERWSRLVWSLLIVFGFLVGPLAWFMYGRPGRRLPAPWDKLLPGPERSTALAPDDDPDFLADLRRRRGTTTASPQTPGHTPGPDGQRRSEGAPREDSSEGAAPRDEREASSKKLNGELDKPHHTESDDAGDDRGATPPGQPAPKPAPESAPDRREDAPDEPDNGPA